MVLYTHTHTCNLVNNKINNKKNLFRTIGKIENVRKNSGITLIALIVTIIILIILAGVTLGLILDNDGILLKAKTASNEYNKQSATETMNLKITNVQMSKYAKEQRMPTLKELADELCEDNDMEYVLAKSKVHASLDKIDGTNLSSIYTKLKAYPYEFEINSSLQLASIDGVKVATVPTDDNDTIVSMTKAELQNMIDTTVANSLKNYSTTTEISEKYVEKKDNEKLGKLLYSGSFNSGSINVPELEKYSYIIAICDMGWAVPLYKAQDNMMYGIGGRGGPTTTSNETIVMGLSLSYNGNTLTYIQGKYGTINNVNYNNNLTILKIYGIF